MTMSNYYVQSPYSMSNVQDCAAKHTLQYARACSFADLKFARPAAPEVMSFLSQIFVSCILVPGLTAIQDACALQAHQVQVEKTALNFAEHTLWALQKGSDTQNTLQDPPLYARPAIEPPQQSPQPQHRASSALSKIPKLTASRSFAPCLTAGWAPKVRF